MAISISGHKDNYRRINSFTFDAFSYSIAGITAVCKIIQCTYERVYCDASCAQPKAQIHQAITRQSSAASSLLQSQFLSSSQDLIFLSSSSRSTQSLSFFFWSLSWPLFDPSVADPSPYEGFFFHCRNSLSMLHQLMKHTRDSPDRQKCLNYALHCKHWWCIPCVQLSV